MRGDERERVKLKGEREAKYRRPNPLPRARDRRDYPPAHASHCEAGARGVARKKVG